MSCHCERIDLWIGERMGLEIMRTCMREEEIVYVGRYGVA